MFLFGGSVVIFLVFELAHRRRRDNYFSVPRYIKIIFISLYTTILVIKTGILGPYKKLIVSIHITLTFYLQALKEDLSRGIQQEIAIM
jgi:hypothetical protein